jgi:hypothetical protein
MRETLTLRLNPDVVKAAKRKAQADNRTLTNYIETLMIRDLQGGSSLQVIAPPDIRDYVAVPLPGETKSERKFRDALFHAILDKSGH